MLKPVLAGEPKAVAIIQARMRSTRLPGKVLREVVGRPLLWHILHRLRRSHRLNEIVIATSTDPADDAIAAFAQQEGVLAIRGPEENVLERFVIAARQTHADIILRVNADAPLIDAAFTDFLIHEMLAAQADFVVPKSGMISGHDGADPFTRRALEKLWAEAAHDPVAREHVSAYFKAHPDFVKVAEIDLPDEYRFEGARLSIDTPSDVEFIEEIYATLSAQAGEASLTDLLALLRREPELRRANAHVRQKLPGDGDFKVLMRCDGGGPLGFGHVMRSLALAEALRDRHGAAIRFAMKEEPAAIAAVRARAFPVDPWPEDMAEAPWVRALLCARPAAAAIFDTPLPHGNDAVLAARKAGALTLTIDDGTIRHVAADIATFPPVPQVQRLNWRSSAAERIIGWDWVLLARPPLERAFRPADVALRILITLGGSDPKGWTVPAARAAVQVLGSHHVTVVIGPGFEDAHMVEHRLRQLPGPLTILKGISDLRPIMAASDIAIAYFGVTAYELAAAGVPSILLALTEDHAHSAMAFEKAHMAHLIRHRDVSERRIADALNSLIASPAALLSMHIEGRRQVDGRGAERLAAVIAERCVARRAALKVAV